MVISHMNHYFENNTDPILKSDLGEKKIMNKQKMKQ